MWSGLVRRLVSGLVIVTIRPYHGEIVQSKGERRLFSTARPDSDQTDPDWISNRGFEDASALTLTFPFVIEENNRN